MYVYLEKIEVDISSETYVASCQTAAEYGSLIADIGNRIMQMDESARRILIHLIPQEMSTLGRDFIEALNGSILQFTRNEVEEAAKDR